MVSYKVLDDAGRDGAARQAGGVMHADLGHEVLAMLLDGNGVQAAW